MANIVSFSVFETYKSPDRINDETNEPSQRHTAYVLC